MELDFNDDALKYTQKLIHGYGSQINFKNPI